MKTGEDIVNALNRTGGYRSVDPEFERKNEQIKQKKKNEKNEKMSLEEAHKKLENMKYEQKNKQYFTKEAKQYLDSAIGFDEW